MNASFLTAEWRHLLFVNFEIDPTLAQRYVPRGTELDLLDGRALASIVAFRFLKTRLLGVPVPWHRDFDEINLRLYVRHRTPDGWRRGVTFVRELVPRPAIAWTARLAYNEPYRAVRMRHAISMDPMTGGSLRYGWRQSGSWHEVGATVTGPNQPIEPDSTIGFVTEHYFGYTRQRNDSTVEYAVHHDRWRVWPDATTELKIDIPAVYGADWAPALTAPPFSAFVCDGASVAIGFPREVDLASRISEF